MKTPTKNEREWKDFVIEVKVNGMPDFSLMPSEELKMLARGLEKAISELVEAEREAGG